MSTRGSDLQPEPVPTVRRLAGNTLVQVGGQFAASAIGFLTFVAVTRGLGSSGFGAMTTALVFLMLPVVLSDVGLSTALLREISSRPERTEPAMRAALPLRVAVSTAAVALAIAGSYLLPFSPETHTAIAIGGVGAFFTLLTLSLLPVLQAQLRMHWAMAGTVIGRVVTLAATIAALATGHGLKAVMLAHVAGLFVTFLVHLVAVARVVSLLPEFDVGYWKSLVRGSIVIGLALSISQIYFRIDTLLIAALRGPEEVGLYGAAFKLVELWEMVGAAAGITAFPLLARFVRSDTARARSLFQRTLDVLLAAAAPIVVLMLLRPVEIMTFISGPNFAEAGDALRLLAPYSLFAFAVSLLWRTLLAWGEDRPLLAVAFGLLTANVALNLLLIPPFGFRAAAAVAVVTQVLALVALGALAYRRHRFLGSLRYTAAVVPAALVMAAVLLVLPLHVAIAAPIASVAYVAVLAAAPGTVRHVIAESLLPALRRIA